MQSDDVEISLNDTEFVIGRWLQGIDNLPPIAWQNKEFNDKPPYIEFRHSPNTIINDRLGSGFEHRLGIFLMTVVMPRNESTVKANEIAETIVRRFPKALHLVREGDEVVQTIVRRRTVTINEPSIFGAGFYDGTYWRQPVTVFYITE